MVPGHVLVRRNFAARRLPLVDHPTEEGVCGVVDTAGVPFDADPHLEDIYLRQGSKTPRLEVDLALLVQVTELPQSGVETAMGELGGSPRCRIERWC